MKHVNKLIWVITLCLAVSCSKNDDKIDRPGYPGEGLITPVGTPVESEINETEIGRNGGVLYSRDGRMQLIVPAGAVNETENFSIQRITNTNPLGKGLAYRMKPHGIKFAKPVTLVITHDELDRRGTLPAALNIAFQDDRGIWQAMGGKRIDEVNATISIQTDHFSDYSLFESFSIRPGFSIVDPGKSVQLEVISTEDLLAVPLTPDKTVPIGRPIPVIAHYIKTNSWALNGEGSLNRAGHIAIYNAPTEIAGDNSASVSVELDLGQSREQLILVAAIKIAEEGELEMSVGGGPVTTKKGYRIVQVIPGQYGIAHSEGYEEDGSVLLIRWKGGLGAHPWNAVALDHPDANTFSFSPKNSNTNYYNAFYAIEDKVLDSGGGLTITDMGNSDGFVRGTFSVQPTGHGILLTPSVTISGRFRLKKTW